MIPVAMPSNPASPPPSRSWLDRNELFRGVLHGWFTVIFVACGVIAVQVHMLHNAPTTYQAQMQVTTTQGGASDTNGRFASLAQIANIALPAPQSGSNYTYYVDSLTSRDVADVLAKDPKIMHTIF